MIITCNNCNKKFDADPALIPEIGRLVQCNSCDHKWFFKKEIKERSVPIVKIKDIADESGTLKDEVIRVETETPKTIDLLDRVTDDISVIEKISTQNNNLMSSMIHHMVIRSETIEMG